MEELDILEVEKFFLKKYKEGDELEDRVTEEKQNFLDEDWEEKYESIDEAYDETNHGEAEDVVIHDLCNEVFEHFFPNYPRTTLEQKTLLHTMYLHLTQEELSDTIKRLYPFLDC
jgi:hypothetical protein